MDRFNFIDNLNHLVGEVERKAYRDGYSNGRSAGRADALTAVSKAVADLTVPVGKPDPTNLVEAAAWVRAHVPAAVEYLAEDRVIQGIKEVRSATGWGLKESKDVADYMRSNR